MLNLYENYTDTVYTILLLLLWSFRVAHFSEYKLISTSSGQTDLLNMRRISFRLESFEVL